MSPMDRRRMIRMRAPGGNSEGGKPLHRILDFRFGIYAHLAVPNSNRKHTCIVGGAFMEEQAAILKFLIQNLKSKIELFRFDLGVFDDMSGISSLMG